MFRGTVLARPRWTFLLVGDPQAGVAEYAAWVASGRDLAALSLPRLLSGEDRVGREQFEPFREGPEAFLTRAVFDADPRPAAVVGLVAGYRDLDRYDLYDYVQHRYRVGSFSVVELVRAPLACCIARHAPAPDYPGWAGDAAELVRAHRETETARRRLARACLDRLEVPYAERRKRLVEVSQFVEAPPRVGRLKTFSAAGPRRPPKLGDLVRCPPVLRRKLPADLQAEFDLACQERHAFG